MALCRPRRDPDGVAIRRLGLGRPALPLQRHAEVVVGAAVRRIERDRFSVCRSVTERLRKAVDTGESDEYDARLAGPRLGCYSNAVDRTGASIAVQVEIPREVLGDADPSQLAVELRRLWAVEQVRRRRLGVGKAAEVAGMPRAAFMQLLGEHGVPVIDYPVEDLQEELRSLGSG